MTSMRSSSHWEDIRHWSNFRSCRSFAPVLTGVRCIWTRTLWFLCAVGRKRKA